MSNSGTVGEVGAKVRCWIGFESLAPFRVGFKWLEIPLVDMI